jgi:hypothetical protein
VHDGLNHADVIPDYATCYCLWVLVISGISKCYAKRGYKLCFVAAETLLKDTSEKMNEIDASNAALQNRINPLAEGMPVLQANISDFNKQVWRLFSVLLIMNCTG